LSPRSERPPWDAGSLASPILSNGVAGQTGAPRPRLKLACHAKILERLLEPLAGRGEQGAVARMQQTPETNTARERGLNRWGGILFATAVAGALAVFATLVVSLWWWNLSNPSHQIRGDLAAGAILSAGWLLLLGSVICAVPAALLALIAYKVLAPIRTRWTAAAFCMLAAIVGATAGSMWVISAVVWNTGFYGP
jgi:hypothetical protein